MRNLTMNRRESLRNGRSRPGPLARLLHCALAIGTLWFGGFLFYCATIPTSAADHPAKADGIVVLTGGAERLKEGIRLLQEGSGDKLLISGVDPSVNLQALMATLAQEDQPRTELISCCIALDQRASSTIDNARETRAWVEAEGLHSLILVTANYHINRAMLEYRAAMPDIAILPQPVFPEEVKAKFWFIDLQTLSLLVNEYHKSLVAKARHGLETVPAGALALWRRMTG